MKNNKITLWEQSWVAFGIAPLCRFNALFLLTYILNLIFAIFFDWCIDTWFNDFWNLIMMRYIVWWKMEKYTQLWFNDVNEIYDEMEN